MGSWHRENPELIGTEFDPWMVNESYRRLAEVRVLDHYEDRCAPDDREDEREDEREPTDDEIYNGPGMEGGIPYGP